MKQDLAELSQEAAVAKKVKLEPPGNSISSSSSPHSDRERERDCEQRDRGPSDSKTSAKISENTVVAPREKPRERLREIEEDIFFGPSATSSSSRAKEQRERQERVTVINAYKSYICFLGKITLVQAILHINTHFFVAWSVCRLSHACAELCAA